MTEEKFPFQTLAVPGEDGVWFCAKHSQTQTRLRCGRCEKPICPKCTSYGPTGARCRDCLSNRTSHVYQVSPKILALAFGACALAGALGALLIQLAGFLWLLVLLYAPALGPTLARWLVKASGGKRGPKIAVPAMLGVVVGALGAGILSGTITHIAFWLMLPIALWGIWRELT